MSKVWLKMERLFPAIHEGIYMEVLMLYIDGSYV